MRVFAGVVVGAALGALSTSFGLIDTTFGELSLGYGNEWTPVVTGTGIIAGGAVGATSFFRRHVFAFLLFGIGLLIAIAIRDEFLLQPPVVFFNLLGIPLAGAVIGVLLDYWRDRTRPRPTTTVLVGLAVTVPLLLVTFIALRTFEVPLTECETVGNMVRCGGILQSP